MENWSGGVLLYKMSKNLLESNPLKVAPYSLVQFTNDLYRSVRLDVILATFAWNFRSSAKFLKQEQQNLFLSAVMYQNLIILHYFLDFLKS